MRKPAAFLLLMFLFAGGLPSLCVGQDPTVGSDPCRPKLQASRWMPEKADYTDAGVFGRSEAGWLGATWGLARSTTAGQIFVEDLGNPRVVVLDDALVQVGEFAREGEGPGEIRLWRGGLDDYRHPQWLAVGDSVVLVFDTQALSVFTLDGQFLRRVSSVSPGKPAFFSRIVGIAWNPGGALLGVDDPGVRGMGDHVLQTWWATDQGLELLFETDAAPIARPGGVPTIPPNQALPLWTARGGCIVHSDGHAKAILWSPTMGVADTIHLPSYDPPAATRADREMVERAGELARRVTGRDLPQAEPTLLWRFGDLRLDPDGFLWLNGWRPFSGRGGSVTVFIVNPENGAFQTIDLPAFPTEFGAPGVFYTLTVDPSTGAQIVVRYELRSGAGG